MLSQNISKYIISSEFILRSLRHRFATTKANSEHGEALGGTRLAKEDHFLSFCKFS